jgi:hypothetical protein
MERTTQLRLIHSILIWAHSGNTSEILKLSELSDISSLKLYVDDEITLHHSFATTIIAQNGITHYDIDGDRSDHALNDENIMNYVEAVLCEISYY